MHSRGLAAPAVVLFALFTPVLMASAQVEICPAVEQTHESCDSPVAAVPVVEAAASEDVAAPVTPKIDLSPPARDDWPLDMAAPVTPKIQLSPPARDDWPLNGLNP